MKRAKNIIITWGWLHIIFIIGVCIFSAYNKYHMFYKLEQNKAFTSTTFSIFFNEPMRYYGRWTGCGTSYGFFAPNIKANGIIIGDCDGEKITPQFKNFESAMRFGSLSSRVTEYLIEDKHDSTSKEDVVLEAKFYDLLFKNIAVKMYNQNKCLSDTLFVSYNIIDFPSLKSYRKNTKQDYILRPVKEIRLTKLEQ